MWSWNTLEKWLFEPSFHCSADTELPILFQKKEARYFEIPRFPCRKHDNGVPHKSPMSLTGLRPSKQKGKGISNRAMMSQHRTKSRYRFSSSEKVSSESNASWNAKHGHSALSKCERERKGSESLPPIDVVVWCLPKRVCMCVCAWERVKLWHGKYGQHAAPAAAAPITGPSLRHPEPMTDARTQVWVRERATLTVITTRRGSSDTGSHKSYTPPPRRKGCMTTVCAYALQKQACEMSHDCDMSLVQCLLPIFWFTSESAWTSARIGERLKKKTVASY